jgi:hypothetical protein
VAASTTCRVQYWELKIKDRALKKKVKASLSEEDDENSPFSRIAELGFENVDGSWEIRVSADDGTKFDFARLKIIDADADTTSKRKTTKKAA